MLGPNVTYTYPAPKYNEGGKKGGITANAWPTVPKRTPERQQKDHEQITKLMDSLRLDRGGKKKGHGLTSKRPIPLPKRTLDQQQKESEWIAKNMDNNLLNKPKYFG
jgi:uncharacterized protein YoaH (UPF0181 family)